MEFVRGTPGYAFDCGAGFFCEEQIFTERWFQPGGVPDGFRMWEQSAGRISRGSGALPLRRMVPLILMSTEETAKRFLT